MTAFSIYLTTYSIGYLFAIISFRLINKYAKEDIEFIWALVFSLLSWAAVIINIFILLSIIIKKVTSLYRRIKEVKCIN